jgi:hypothetical protein
MCEVSKGVLDVVGDTMQKEVKTMFEKVISDIGQQGQRMTKLEKKVNSLDKKVGILEGKVDTGFASVASQIKELKDLLEKKEPTLFEKIRVLGTKEYLPMWICILAIILILGSLFGVPFSDIKGIISMNS